jgi:integrase
VVYKVSGGRSFVFQALTPTGAYVQLGTGAKDRAVAKDIEHMWGKLAQKRAWDLLQPILTAQRRERARRLVQLYDRWRAAEGNVEAVRQRQQDRDVEPLVEEWSGWYRGEVAATTASDALAFVRWLLPAGTPRLASAIDAAWLTAKLTAYPGKRNTRRKVHSHWTSFFGYCRTVHKLWPASPMLDVPRPPAEETPIRFYELEVAQQIVGWQPTPARRAVMALFYGTGIEASIPAKLTRRMFDPTTKSVRAAGTKTRTRDRVSRVADWAWPIVWEYVKTFLPDAHPWPGLTRYTASKWHRQTVSWDKETKAGLNLPARHPLHCARDHWAVRYLRSGGAIQVVASQLGHADPNVTLRKYGRFRPDDVDRERMEEQATAYDARRRTATP